MKKSTRKLVIHSETLRALADLEFVRAGNGAALMADTGGAATGCPLQANLLPKK